MSGDLENGVDTRVNDRPAAAAVGLTQTLNDFGTAGRFISERLEAGSFSKNINNFKRKTIGKGGEWFFLDQAGKFPVTDDGILPGGNFLKASKGRDWLAGRSDMGQGNDVSKAHARQIGEMKG
jgi:hypothetical protein